MRHLRRLKGFATLLGWVSMIAVLVTASQVHAGNAARVAPNAVVDGTKAEHTLWAEKIVPIGMGTGQVNWATMGPDGSIYLGTSLQVVRTDGSRVTYTSRTSPALAGDYVNTLYLAPNGDLYVGHNWAGITILRADGTVSYWNGSTTPSLSGTDIRHVWADANGDTYVSSKDTALDIIHPDLSVTRYTNNSQPGVVGGSTFTFRDSTTGQLYSVGGRQAPDSPGGLTIINPNGSTTHYDVNTNPGLVNNNAIHLSKDSNGDLYISHDSTFGQDGWNNDGGLSVLHTTGSVETYQAGTTPLFPSNRVFYSWKDSRDNLYVGTSQGLWKKSTPKGIALYSSILGSRVFLQTEVQPNGDMLVATENGALIIRGFK
ncbi:MAG: hypothetical protein HW403_387 [Dehalococcoidia bacterium]|nr:hypothetical protein [Dehalococcoidia bacterium]